MWQDARNKGSSQSSMAALSLAICFLTQNLVRALSQDHALQLVTIPEGVLCGLDCLRHAPWPLTGTVCPLVENDSGFSDGAIVVNAWKAVCQFIPVLFLIPEIYVLTFTSVPSIFKALYLCSKR